jgi:hypothetical protein
MAVYVMSNLNAQYGTNLVDTVRFEQEQWHRWAQAVATGREGWRGRSWRYDLCPLGGLALAERLAKRWRDALAAVSRAPSATPTSPASGLLAASLGAGPRRAVRYDGEVCSVRLDISRSSAVDLPERLREADPSGAPSRMLPWMVPARPVWVAPHEAKPVQLYTQGSTLPTAAQVALPRVLPWVDPAAMFQMSVDKGGATVAREESNGTADSAPGNSPVSPPRAALIGADGDAVREPSAGAIAALRALVGVCGSLPPISGDPVARELAAETRAFICVDEDALPALAGAHGDRGWCTPIFVERSADGATKFAAIDAPVPPPSRCVLRFFFFFFFFFFSFSLS